MSDSNRTKHDYNGIPRNLKIKCLRHVICYIIEQRTSDMLMVHITIYSIVHCALFQFAFYLHSYLLPYSFLTSFYF
jgi:hypothetical protein